MQSIAGIYHKNFNLSLIHLKDIKIPYQLIYQENLILVNLGQNLHFLLKIYKTQIDIILTVKRKILYSKTVIGNPIYFLIQLKKQRNQYHYQSR